MEAWGLMSLFHAARMLTRRDCACAEMKIIEVVATICGGVVIAFMFAGCSASDISFAPGLPWLLSTGLPATCSEPAAFKPGSACAKDLAAAQCDPNFKIRDNQATRPYFDDACADDAAWQSGSTCHLLTDVLERETGSPVVSPRDHLRDRVRRAAVARCPRCLRPRCRDPDSIGRSIWLERILYWLARWSVELLHGRLRRHSLNPRR